MSATVPHRRRWPSVVAVAGGFVATFVLSVATDAALHAAGVFPALGQPMAEPLFVVATVYRVAYTVAGGWITARLAPDRPMWHAMVLAAIGLAASLAGVVAWWVGGAALGPGWYPVTLLVTSVPAIWAGAKLRERQARGSR